MSITMHLYYAGKNGNAAGLPRKWNRAEQRT